MAYEPSEGLYAGLSLIDTPTLMEATSNENKFKEVYRQAFNFLSTDKTRILDGAGDTTRKGLIAAIDLSKATEKKTSDIYNDCAGALSAVLATRKDIKSGEPAAVYLTGNKWNKNVEDFKVEAFGMADYNSSDLILQYDAKKPQFAGVSLKKKRKANAPSPTLINNAFSKFLQGKEFLNLRKKLDKERKQFFAEVIKEAASAGGPLANFAALDNGKSIAKLNPKKEADVKTLWGMKVATTKIVKKTGKNEVVPLINLKDEDQLLSSNSGVLSKDSESKFRKFINDKLKSTGKLNPLYQKFYNAMNDPGIKDTLADALLSRVLKLKLLDELDTWKEKEFGFYVVEGVGSYKNGSVNVSNAAVYDIHNVMCAIASLAKEKSIIEIDEKSTFGKDAAKVFFTLSKGETPILDIELRYKGSFTAMPQFFATMNPAFQKLLKDGGCSEITR
tara:strand:- start:269 stop:1606 length:1338 start_codon:yes stop_codon:yes gene_type:complete